MPPSTAPRTPQRRLLAATLLAAAWAVAACGGGGGDAADPAAAAADTTSPAAGTSTGTSTSPSPAGTAADLVVTPSADPNAAALDIITTEPTADVAVPPADTAAAAPDAGTMATAQAIAGGTPSLTVRARADLAGGVGAMLQLRVAGAVVGSVEVRATAWTNYVFSAPALKAGAAVDVVYTNDGVVNGADRNLYVAYLSDGASVVLPTIAGAVYDRGTGSKAFDGLDTLAGQGNLYWSGALRLAWPAAVASTVLDARRTTASRFLQQASFGPTVAEIDKVASLGVAAWIDQQIALPASTDYVPYVEKQFAKGDSWRPGGSNYTPAWVGQKFWANAATAPDQLRKRMAFALHHTLMISQADSALYYQARAYADTMDMFNRRAFGNYRALLEDLALSPAMGLWLSHMRNRKEDAATGRLPDENFARELMQLFTIGLVELNSDGSVKRDAAGNAIETYSNADVMALAKVFTGLSWAYPDSQLSEQNFRWGTPALGTAAADQRIDRQPMKAYAAEHSSAAKPLFAGKPWAATIAAGGTALADVRAALDVLFNHPNVGPFIGRQLIQQLVTSNPSPAYVARVAAVFNNNGKGVRGDLAAVARAILLDTEARGTPPLGLGKLREPVLRVAHWMRAFNARSASGEYMLAWHLDNVQQRVLNAPSVFGYFRPGYVPPNTALATAGATAPEFQILDESTSAIWINLAESLAGGGLGWNGSSVDVVSDYAALVAAAAGGNLAALADQLNLLMLGGRMSATLRQAILDAAGGVSGSGTTTDLNRARAAVFLTLASPEYLVQQ